MNLKIEICRLHSTDRKTLLPRYATNGSAGMDICASLEADMTIARGAIVLIPTGLSIALPHGYECQVRSRSGLAAKNGIFTLNSPGTIDSDYRGEIKVILANFGSEPFVVKHGDRIAQLVVARYESVEWREVEELGATDRNIGGFGSTGIS